MSLPAIIDKDGRFAGIVVSGDEQQNLIRAVVASPFIAAIIASLNDDD